MQALGASVLVADHSARDVETVPLKVLLAQSSLIVCLAVATAETADLMNVEAFAMMRPGSLSINASCGELVDDAALADALTMVT